MTIKNRSKLHIKLTTGDILKELRIKKGWTQATLAKITGIAVPNISNLEHDRSRLGEERAIILAEAFGVKPEFLLFPNGTEREDLRDKIKRVKRELAKLERDCA